MKFDHVAVRSAMEDKGITQASLCRATGAARSTMNRAILQGLMPTNMPDLGVRIYRALGLEIAETGMEICLNARNPKARVIGIARDMVSMGQSRDNGSAPVTTPATSTETDGHSLDEKEHLMLIRKCSLTPEARNYWKIFGAALAAPWQRDQVFLGGEMRVAYEHMLAKARYGGLLAVVGESGSGKTTLKDLLVGDLAAEGEVIVIEPHTQRMEEDDRAGKTLKGADIVDAIMREIAPTASIRRTAEAQLNQVAAALSASLAQGRDRRHLLVIDEAHSLPKPTLRHLKRFLELKNPNVKGLQRPMLSIVLLGQPELAVRLSPYDQTVREVWQRCELVHLRPLDKALGEYVALRIGDAAKAFEPSALAKFAENLADRHGTSYLYPLAVDSWLAEILNATAGLAKSITAEAVEEVFADVRHRFTQRGGR
ncbi:MAG: AAA family ATPase [Azoarcus sp.]|jgi:type II secretory pathway predicted ATPase ExeA|nr:AAA family ATPase [Azoarcus sp.]